MPQYEDIKLLFVVKKKRLADVLKKEKNEPTFSFF